jgi:hypothetical protein
MFSRRSPPRKERQEKNSFLYCKKKCQFHDSFWMPGGCNDSFCNRAILHISYIRLIHSNHSLNFVFCLFLIFLIVFCNANEKSMPTLLEDENNNSVKN